MRYLSLAMFAVIKTGGKQYLVENDDVINVERTRSGKAPEAAVLLLFDGKNVEIGNPFLKNAIVKLEVVQELLGPKIRILKHRAKKHSRTRSGHRQKSVKAKIKISKNSEK